MWYGLVDPATGALISVGTIGMFPDGNLDAFDGIYDVHEFGLVAPNFATHLWSTTLRQLATRPAPVIVSRLDDFEAWLLSDPDFLLAWNALNATRKAQVRLGMRRILTRMLGSQVNRQQEETPEI
jgi:hypothetical protein